MTNELCSVLLCKEQSDIILEGNGICKRHWENYCSYPDRSEAKVRFRAAMGLPQLKTVIESRPDLEILFNKIKKKRGGALCLSKLSPRKQENV